MELFFTVVLIAAIVIGIGRLTRARAARALPLPGSSIEAAQADARRWLDKLGASLPPLADDAGVAAAESHLEASRRYEHAREQFVRATSPYEYSLAGRTAIVGIHYVGAYFAALGLEGAPSAPSTGPALVRAAQVDVAGTGYYGAPHPSDAMPYYFPGGTVAGRIVPGGWYGQAWWRTPGDAGATYSLRKPAAYEPAA